MTNIIQDAAPKHWVYKLSQPWLAFAQLSRLDRPIGYWLLCLPGWVGLAFASLTHGFAISDLKWALLIFIGSIAMRGAGCTYNDIVDQDLDAKVERTALRPLPAGTITTKQAWLWLLAQCIVGLIVLLCLPRLAQIISLCSLPLVAAYPFMKRITWWPQLWLGLVFTWSVLVAYAAKTEALTPQVLTLYAGFIFWAVGYDTIYACQDIEDDAIIGVKSTARRFGKYVRAGVGGSFALFMGLTAFAVAQTHGVGIALLAIALPSAHFAWQTLRFNPDESTSSLKYFKSNRWAALILTASLLALAYWSNAFPMDIPS